MAERTAISDWQLAISPNPVASGFATVSLTRPPEHSGTGALRLSIYNATGRLVHSSFAPRTSSFRLDLRSMPAGVYLVKVEVDDFSATQRLVVQK
jgi:hypothetical protein